MIGGTSMGACISAEHALGWDAETMTRRNQEIFGKWKSDVTLPIIAILNGQRSAARLRTTIGDVRIEDMWLPFFCVSSNLSRAEIVVHRDGPLWIGLRASAGLPGIFPPLVHNGDLLVDGGFLRNLPADIMRQLTEGGTTMAVDVSSECDMQDVLAYVHSISGWRIVWNRLNPFSRKLPVPSIAAVLQRSSEIASVSMQRDALLQGVDLYVRMPVQRFGMLEFERSADIIKTGYDRRVPPLPTGWPAQRARRTPSQPPRSSHPKCLPRPCHQQLDSWRLARAGETQRLARVGFALSTPGDRYRRVQHTAHHCESKRCRRNAGCKLSSNVIPSLRPSR